MNRGDLKTYVLERLGATGSATTTQVEVVLGQVYQQVVLRHRLLMGYAALTVTAGDSTVTLPADLARIQGLSWGTRRMMPVTDQEFAVISARDEQGYVSPDEICYYIFAGTTSIEILPVPDATEVGAIKCWYLKQPTAMASDTDSPSAVPEAFHDLLAELTVHRIALGEEELGLANAAYGLAQTLERDLQAHVSARAGADDYRVWRPTAFRR